MSENVPLTGLETAVFLICALSMLAILGLMIWGLFEYWKTQTMTTDAPPEKMTNAELAEYLEQFVACGVIGFADYGHAILREAARRLSALPKGPDHG